MFHDDYPLIGHIEVKRCRRVLILCCNWGIEDVQLEGHYSGAIFAMAANSFQNASCGLSLLMLKLLLTC
jgi:hypothetical protein